MPLSCGWFDGQNLECSYHGWKFDAHSGQCQLIPSLTSDQDLKVDRIYAGSYTCEEHDDFILGIIPEPPPPSAGFGKAAQPSTSAPRSSNFWWKLQDRSPERRPACSVITALSASWTRRTGHCASGLVVAQPPQHPREAKEFRADPDGLSHERGTPPAQTARPTSCCGCMPMRIRSPRLLILFSPTCASKRSARKVLVLEPDHSDANHAQPIAASMWWLAGIFFAGYRSERPC